MERDEVLPADNVEIHDRSLGVVYIAYGWKAQNEVKLSRATLEQHNHIPVTVISGDTEDNIRASREAKTRLLDLSPYDNTLYLDADTRIHGDVTPGFDMLDDGWDIVVTPSDRQGRDWLWHVGEQEREVTLKTLGHQWLQWQCGVMWVKRTPSTQTLFETWHEEWQEWQGQDQAAFLRALDTSPVTLWALGHDWNGGKVIEHCFGRARG